ncbi:hypothetical protein BD414DRAFT_5089 [Trametes punicea]|nr:hypothetical protein BD414DRAFT_5089 [Trametes punicea]
MGSKHGTFVQQASLSAPTSTTEGLPAGKFVDNGDPRGVRLSPPRVASMPRTLHHLDRLSIGGTTFVVHIHENGIPCTHCSPQALEQEVPLFSHRIQDSDQGVSKKRKVDAYAGPSSSSSDIPQHRDPKKALAMLRRNLLSTRAHPGPASDSRPPQYVDRSARRRALHPDHSLAKTPAAEPSRCTFSPVSMPTTPPPLAPVSIPPAPLPSSNIGHRLLMKQGWQPGTALGDSASGNGGLVTPLEPSSTVGRAGLGASVRVSGSAPEKPEGDWKDAGQRRRWMELHGNKDIS